VAFVAATWLFIDQEIRREERDAAQAAIRQATNRALALEQYVSRTLETADLATGHIAQHYLIEGGARHASPGSVALIRDPVVDLDTVAALHVLDPEGVLIASTLQPPPPRRKSRHPAFLAHLSDTAEGLKISSPLPSSYMKGEYVSLSRRVRSSDGRHLGFVGAQIRPQELLRGIKDNLFHPTDLVSVIGLDGITRARREGDAISAGQDLSGRLVMRMQARNPDGVYLGPSSLDGKVRYFSHRRLDGYPLFVSAGVEREAALAGVRKRATVFQGSALLLTKLALGAAALVHQGMRDRHRRLAALAHANDRLRLAQRVAKVGDWELEMHTGDILWSDQLCEMYERDTACDRLSVQDFHEYLDDEGRAAASAAIHAAIDSAKPQTYDFKVYLPSGAVAHRHTIAVPVLGSAGQVLSVHGTDQDVTSDHLLETLQEQVAELSRVDAMNTMAATLAHELNQPLTAASNYLAGGARLLAGGGAGSADGAAEAVAEARKQVTAAGDVIKRVRAMLGKRTFLTETASLGAVLDDALSILRSTGASDEVEVTRELDPSVDLVWVDKVQLQQVFLNLIRNACEAARGREAPHVWVSSEWHSGETALVRVRDNGAGIDPDRRNLFSPFSSEKEGGLGLGLSICRTIVEYHGGRIWVERTGADGTAISFTARTRPGIPEDLK
jgi:signal transduction histidine kinase